MTRLLCLLRLHKWYVVRVQTFQHFSGGLVVMRCSRCSARLAEYRK